MSKKKEKNPFYLLILLIINLYLIFNIFWTILTNANDILEKFKNINHINDIEYIYLLLRSISFIPLIILSILWVILSKREEIILEKIETDIKDLNISFDTIKMKKVEEYLNEIEKSPKNELKELNFKNEDIKNIFIHSIVNKYRNKVIYIKNLYYFDNIHLKLIIKLKKLFRNSEEKMKMFFLENYRDFCITYSINLFNESILENERNKKEILEEVLKKELSDKKDLYILLSEEDLIEIRNDNLKNLDKEIRSGINSILIDDNWGNGKHSLLKNLWKSIMINMSFCI